jgi:hypothetical protein
MPFFFHRMFSYRPAKPRNPLLKLLLGLVGLVLLALLVVFGLVIGLGMLLFAAARRVFRPRAQVAAPVQAPDVIEGEYLVVNKPADRLSVR